MFCTTLCFVEEVLYVPQAIFVIDDEIECIVTGLGNAMQHVFATHGKLECDDLLKSLICHILSNSQLILLPQN